MSAPTMEHPEAEVERYAELMYATYCAAVGGVAHDGKPLPSWLEFGSDPAKQKQANGWRKTAAMALSTISAGFARALLEILGNEGRVPAPVLSLVEGIAAETKQPLAPSRAYALHVPFPAPSAFGYAVHAIHSGPELGGSMLRFSLENNGGSIQICCTPEWALSFADTLQRGVKRQLDDEAALKQAQENGT